MRRFSSLICCTLLVCETIDENSESIVFAFAAAAIIPPTPTVNAAFESPGPSAVISRTAPPYASSPSTASPPMSPLMIASTGFVVPLRVRPRPSPFFHPIFSRSAKPRPLSISGVLWLASASFAARGTSAAAARTAWLPITSRRRAAFASNLTGRRPRRCRSPPPPRSAPRAAAAAARRSSGPT